jgi:hypothetical protein
VLNAPGSVVTGSGREPAVSPRLSAAWSYGYGLLVVAALGYVLLGMPIQIGDGFTNMVALPGSHLWTMVYNQFFQASYLRPLLWGHLQVIYTLADGNYYEWYRGWHVFQVFLLVVLFIRVLRPRTVIDAAVIPLGLAILVGIHTFAGAIREAFPINTFMTILLCCVGAANLAVGEHRWWRDVAAAVLFVFAALTVESGLLVWVVFAAAYMAGSRGVSRWGVGALTLLLAGYFVLRFVILDIGGPGLIERSSAYGFSVYDPEQLIEKFGENPWPFYVYNILTSAASVLWAEPRAGLFRVTRMFLEDDVRTYMYVNVAASALSTGVIGWFLWHRRRLWLARRLEHSDRIVFMFLGVLAANAVISYPYTKDVIMSPAGVFYALAAAVAARELIAAPWRHRLTAVALVALLAVTSAAWGVRAVAAHVGVRESGAKFRNEWAYIDQWYEAEGKRLTDPASIQLKQQLHDDAIVRHPAQPALWGDWMEWLDLD